MAIQYTPALSLPYPQVTDAPLIASRDLRALAQKMDSEGAQIRGESSAALTAGQAAEALAAQALARADAIEDPIHVGPDEPTGGEELWVDTDAVAPDPGGEVTAADITDATTVGRAVLTAPLSVNARNALSIFTGTRALLDAGTDTAERTWGAKELHEYVTDTAAAAGGAASWDDLTGKPETFPPSAHTHDDRYYTEAEVDAKIAAAIAAQPNLYRSGVRDVSAALVTGWSPAANGVKLSRSGGTITLVLDVYRLGGVSGSAEILPILAGFQPITPGYISIVKIGTGNKPEGWIDRVSTNLRIRDLSAPILDGDRMTVILSWQTVDPIPTTLPGDPA